MRRRFDPAFCGLIGAVALIGLHLPAAAQAIVPADELIKALTPKPAAEQDPAEQERTRSMRTRGNSNFIPAPIESAPSIALNSITFNYNSADLDDNGRRQLDEVAKAHAELTKPDERHRGFGQQPPVRCRSLKLDGHTDAVGTDEYNLSLSRRRVESAKLYLASRGVDVSKLSVEGHGKRQLIEKTDGESRVNRRVEIRCL